MNRSERRLLITVDRWYPEASGGARKLAGRWAEWLAKAGYEVDLVSGRAGAVSEPVSPHPRLAIHGYENPSAPSPSLRNLRMHREATRDIVARLARERAFDVHHGHTPLNFLGAHDALRKTRTRHLYTVHSPYAHELRAQWRPTGLDWKHRLALFLAQFLQDSVLRQADLVHGLSSYTQSLLPRRLQRADSKFRRLPGTVPRLPPPPGDPAIRASSAYPEVSKWRRKRPTFLVIRRIEGRMGLDALLDACVLLRADGWKFCLLIVGTGSRLTALRARRNRLLLQDYVKFLGFVPDDALEEIYRHAHCAILPSTGLECFGLTILEAHLRGLPLIATPIGAIPETIGPDQQGWLTASTGAKDLAARMAEFLGGKLSIDRAQLIARAEGFTEDVIFPQWEEKLLRPLLS